MHHSTICLFRCLYFQDLFVLTYNPQLVPLKHSIVFQEASMIHFIGPSHDGYSDCFYFFSPCIEQCFSELPIHADKLLTNPLGGRNGELQLLNLLFPPQHKVLPKVLAVLCLVTQSCPTLRPHGLQPARLLSPWGFIRQEYWSEPLCPPPGDLPNPEIEPGSPALQADFFYNLNYQGIPYLWQTINIFKYIYSYILHATYEFVG